MRKHPKRMMIATMVVVYGLLIITIALGRTPKLGLDLQGGISVNLQPVKDGKVTDDVDSQDLDDSIEIIRKRVDALGVAEPEVARQGNTITVQLPGAKDQAEVLEAVGKTAQLEFRPVLSMAGQELSGEDRTEAEARVAELRTELGLPDGVTAANVYTEELSKLQEQATAEAPADPAPDAGGETTETTITSTAPEDTSTGNGGNRSASLRQQDETTTTAAPESTTTSAPPAPLNEWGVDTSSEAFGELYTLESQLAAKVTPPEDRSPESNVTLTGENGLVYELGPVALTGSSLSGATAGLQGTAWVVSPIFKSGENGIDKFNEIAAKCYAGDATCPALQQGSQGQLGIVLDGEVISAPTIQMPSFERDQITISGSFDRESAENLAISLRFGSLPVELRPQQSETVSATLGQGALQAGIISGLIGLVLVLGYLVLYYRLLGLITAVSLSISASLLWVLLANLGATITLAGVVGLVASIGISLDSSIVFYENLKEDVRGGATVRASAEKSFSTAYSTIVKADISSLIGAVVLYWLSVGPVRGFAFMLGAATVLDLVAAFFFLRPAVVLLSRSKQGQHPSRFGIPIDDLEPATAAAATASAGTSPAAVPDRPGPGSSDPGSDSGSSASVPTGKEG